MRRMVFARGMVLAAVLLLLPVPVFAQTTEVEVIDVDINSFDDDGETTLTVEFRNLEESLDPSQITVTANGNPVANPRFALLAEDTVAQAVVLVIDASGSMVGAPIDAAKTAAKSFIEQKRPEDFIAIVTFSDEVTVLSEFSNRASTLTERIDTIEAAGGTAMFDGIIRATELFADADSESIRKNMIVLTDGADENSTSDLAITAAAVAGADIRTFGVALESDAFNPADLQSIVAGANGLFLSTSDPEELSGIYGQIRRELGNTAVLRFNVNEPIPTDVEFAVSYGAFVANVVTAAAPGFLLAPASTIPRTTTTVTYQQAAPIIVESELPASADTLKWVGALGLGLTLGLFLFILVSGRSEEDMDNFAKRLAAYGRGKEEDKKKSLIERIPLLGRFAAKAEEDLQERGLLGAINNTLEQGNLPLTAGEAIAAAFGLAGVLGIIVGLVTLNAIMGLVVFVIAIFMVFAIINFVGGREKTKFEKQLPDTLTLLSTSLRAGTSLLQAVEAVAIEAPNPTSREFGRAIAEARLGVDVTDAMKGVTTRTQSKDFEWAVMAIEIQREVGGNLAEVLQTVADTMLARNRLKGEIKALTAEGRISAVVLGSLPFALGGFLWVSNRAYLQPLFEETFGLIAIGVGLLLITAGIIWLRKIINIEV